MISPTLALTIQLLSMSSITPVDAGCQALLIEQLKPLGFEIETMKFDDVTNLWAIKKGSANKSGKIFVFAGHTDVVPTGPIKNWQSDPFVPTQHDGKLYARGAADMKTSIAAFVIAAKEFIEAHPDHKNSIALLITSDEEGPSINGTKRVIETLKERGQKLDYCLVGEPSSNKKLGDTIKNGRRGSLSGKLTIYGKQGHIAYPQLARNPIHMIASVLPELTNTEWDKGNDFFPPTSFQISHFESGTGATNVIPGSAQLLFNFRFSTESSADESSNKSLQKRVEAILTKHHLQSPTDYSLEWTLGGQPFITAPGTLSTALINAIQEVRNAKKDGEVNKEIIADKTILSTTGGTSDGRFIKDICEQLVEFGPINATIHQINENIDLNTIDPLKDIYRGVLEKLIP